MDVSAACAVVVAAIEVIPRAAEATATGSISVAGQRGLHRQVAVSAASDAAVVAIEVLPRGVRRLVARRDLQHWTASEELLPALLEGSRILVVIMVVAHLGVPFMISEFGGIGWSTEGGWGYGTGPKTLEEFYARYQGLVDAQLDNPNLFGFCYTQLTARRAGKKWPLLLRPPP